MAYFPFSNRGLSKAPYPPTANKWLFADEATHNK